MKRKSKEYTNIIYICMIMITIQNIEEMFPSVWKLDVSVSPCLFVVFSGLSRLFLSLLLLLFLLLLFFLWACCPLSWLPGGPLILAVVPLSRCFPGCCSLHSYQHSSNPLTSCNPRGAPPLLVPVQLPPVRHCCHIGQIKTSWGSCLAHEVGIYSLWIDQLDSNRAENIYSEISS